MSQLIDIMLCMRNITPEPSPPIWASELNDLHIEKEAYRKQKQILKVWKRLLNQRRNHFWNALKCEKIFRNLFTVDLNGGTNTTK